MTIFCGNKYIVYIDIPQTQSLPYLEKEFYFIDPIKWWRNSSDRFSIFEKFTPFQQNRIMFPITTNEFGSSYSRFGSADFFYKIKQNDKFNFLPNLTKRSTLSFEEITNNRVSELIYRAANYEKIYVFWSGGIDSTVVLSALLKESTVLSKIVIVCNADSIAENPIMYDTYIKGKFKEENIDDFYSGKLAFTNDALYVTGCGADAISGHSNIDMFDARYPRIYNKSWKLHEDIILDYFTKNNQATAIFAYEHILESLNKNNVVVDSVYDFLWWINFNWGYDVELFFGVWGYSLISETCNLQKFLEENYFPFFNSLAYQEWSLSCIGTGLKIQNNITSNKFSLKKYIFDFNGDKEYFQNKRKEASPAKHTQFKVIKRLIAIDSEYNIYYRHPFYN